MPEADDVDDLYRRGKYRLAWDRKRDGSLRTPFLQIVWYDEESRHNKSRSTGTADIGVAEDALDAFYMLKEKGKAVCSACGQPIRAGGRHAVTIAIQDYLVAKKAKPSYSSICARLGHVSAYLADSEQTEAACEDIDEEWIEAFRDWAIEVPIISPSGKMKDRTPGTVEASVRQLQAVINFAHDRHETLFPAAFHARQPSEVSRTPSYRADIPTIAAMFRYCLFPEGDTQKIRDRKRRDRHALLRFLQISMATWARPDAAHDVSTKPERGQWHSNARILSLNPKGRTQTKKYRPSVPIAHQVAPILDQTTGFFVGVESVRKAFEGMLTKLKLPRDGETGLKLIRRSMATLARKRLGEEHWIQGEIMLGHRKSSTSDIYALFEPSQLGRALAVTEAIIDEVAALVPGAFHRSSTGLSIVEGGLSA